MQGCGGQPLVTFHIGGTQREVDVAQLRQNAFAEELANECRQAAETPTACLDNLLGLGDPECFVLLEFLAAHPEIHFRVGEEYATTLLDGVLLIQAPPEDTARLARWKLAALEAAVLTHGEALDIACSRIQARLRQGRPRAQPGEGSPHDPGAAGRQRRRGPAAPTSAAVSPRRPRARCGRGAGRLAAGP
jgi:hypothetical protein